jgi:dTDP-4-dehydrorhamnose 3,5-epimerase
MCTRGRIWDVAVDVRVGSPTFGKWVAAELSDERPQMMWVPAGFAHGFCALANPSDVEYKCTDVYVASDQRGILWSDPDLRIEWPVRQPILSERDATLPTLAAASRELPRYANPVLARVR